MNVHNATCSCSVELYKQWYNLADFFPNWDISRGFLSVYIIYKAGGISAAAMALELDIIFFSRAGPDYSLGPKLCFYAAFSIYYSPEGLAKLRWAGRRSGDII
jgi:hypothetical protein